MPPTHGQYAAQLWASSQRPPSVGIQATLLLLAGYADENYSCFPGMERMAEETIQSRRTIIRQIALLEEVGVLSREYRYDHRGKRTSNRYFLNLEAYPSPEDWERAKRVLDGLDEEVTDDTRCQPDTPALSAKSGCTKCQNGCTKCHQMSQEQEVLEQEVLEHPQPPRASQSPNVAATDVAGDGGQPTLMLVEQPPNPVDRFEEFWDVYGYKKKRKVAERAWSKAVKRESADKIIEAARVYIEYRKAKAAQEGKSDWQEHTAHPSTWLNDERWNDDVAPIPQQQQSDDDLWEQKWRQEQQRQEGTL